MNDPRLQLLADMLAQYTAMFPDDPVVIVAAEVKEGVAEMTLLSNMCPHDTHDMLDNAASYSSADQQGIIENVGVTAH